MSFDRSTIDNWSSEDVAKFKRKPEVASVLANSPLGLQGGASRLVAEGDSWFDYLPGTDLIDCLRRFHGFQIDNHARAGDTLENMAFGSGFSAVLDSIRQSQPKALLFSAGGNDVAGDEFQNYLNHKLSGLDLVRADVAKYMIDTVFHDYWLKIIAAVAATNPNIFIVTHGYGHTRPTGKGVINLLGLLTFVGPWLLPALQRKGITDPVEQDLCVQTMIDRYNDMLAGLAAQHSKFIYVDLRPLIDKDNDWANELHLKNSAYARVADRMAQAIRLLP